MLKKIIAELAIFKILSSVYHFFLEKLCFWNWQKQKMYDTLEFLAPINFAVFDG